MIWLLEIPQGVSESELQGLLPLLDERRRRRLSDFKVERSRVESILAGALLHYAYDKEYGGPLPEIVFSEHGKPGFVEADAPHFNLSHSRLCRGEHCSPDNKEKIGASADEQCSPLQRKNGLVIACALSREAVGVDVQPLHRYDGKFRRILSEEERRWIEEADSDRRFTEIWTRKEAYGKALGVGLGYELSKTAFSGDFSQGTKYEDWKIRTVPKDGYYLSVCAKEDLELQNCSIETLQAGETEET